jgi:hypothetical protein
VLPTLAAAAAVLLGIFGLNLVFQKSYSADSDRVDKAETYLRAEGKDYSLSACELPVDGDGSVIRCRAKTPAGRTLRLRVDFTPAGEVAGTCVLATRGCS